MEKSKIMEKQKGEKMTNNKIFMQYSQQKHVYDVFGKKMVDLLENLLKNDCIEYQSINYRVKDEEKFKNKVIKKNKYKDIKDITDVCGIRIVTSYSDTVDKVAEIIANQFDVDEENTIDKRKAIDPEKFGYLSLHYIVSLKDDRLSLPEYSMFKDIKVEIQIRSIAQHTWAEIEHDLGYKSKVEIPREIRRDFSRLASLLELVDKEFIEIRKKTEDYINRSEEDINILVKDPENNNENKLNQDTEINKLTLELYIKSSNELQDLSKNICNLIGYELDENSLGVSLYMDELYKAGFKTIQEIDYEIKNNKAHINSFCRKLVKKNGLYREESDDIAVLPLSIGLFYLCYYKIAEQKSKEEIIKYINHLNTTGVEADSMIEEFADGLIESYKEA